MVPPASSRRRGKQGERRFAILIVALRQLLRNARIEGYHAFVAAKLVVHSGNTGSAGANRS